MMASLAESNVQNMIQLFHGTFHAQPQTRMQAEMELNKVYFSNDYTQVNPKYHARIPDVYQHRFPLDDFAAYCVASN